ncbi:hypothetical protein B0H14DRAFT_2894320 [Mycena olivaceomarginata]|nr:hypothetical protein B0H14DRAFT_2894320 [Mycena olivaceomarginata]
MVILAADFLLFCAYILGKSYLGKWCRAENVDEDEEVYFYSSLPLHLVDKQKSIPAPKVFSPPTIVLPTLSATLNGSDPCLSHRQMRPVYVSQADMLSSRRSFFG